MENILKENISLWQLFVLIINFEMGSAIVLGLGNQAKQDAWLAIFLATFYGVGLTSAYAFLLRKGSGKNLYEMMAFAGGKIFSKAITFIYVIYFFYLSARVIRDFGELMTTAIMPNTPLEIISLAMFLLIIYILYLGLENLGRLMELFTPYMVLFLFMISLLLIISGEFSIKNLYMPFHYGFAPIAKTIFPGLLAFPFGNMIVFTIIMAQTSKEKYSGKVGMAAVGISGIILTFSTLLQLGTLGVDARMRSNFPLFSAVRNISIANFIERLESIVVFILLIGVIGKSCLYFYVGLKGVEHLTNMAYRSFIFPMGMFLAFFSVLMSENFSELMDIGINIIPVYIDLPIQVGIPALTLVLVLWKQKKIQKMGAR